MDAVQALRVAFEAAHNWYNGTISDVTEAQANHLPTGIAHPVGELMAHIVQSEDGIINGMLQKKPALWDSQGWCNRIDVPNVMMHDNATARRVRLNPKSADFAAYTKAVQAQTLAYVSSLKPADLDFKGPFFPGGEQTRAFILATLIGNTFAHTGEISALKGLQGSRGYPF